MKGVQTRRRYLRVLGGIGTVGIAGCAGGETANEANTATTKTTTAATTTTTTTTETTTTQAEPDFEVSIQAPDTVTNTESWNFEIQIRNRGGRGEFSSPISFRINDGDWQNWDSIHTDTIENGGGWVYESNPVTPPAPMEFRIRVDDSDVSKTVRVEWAEKYKASNIRGSATSPTYDDLFRNFEAFKGEQIHFLYGDVYQTLYGQEDTRPRRHYYQMYVTNNQQEYEGDIAADWYGDGRLLENDIIELWGVAEELYSYETVEGDTRTIPRITLVDFELRNE